MNAAPAEARQALIRQLLRQLTASQAPTVQVRLLARVAPGPEGVRGILNPSPRPAADVFVPPAAPADESDVPPPFRADAPALAALRVGHELHVVVTAPQAGHLHLFNLGCSGEVRKMLPRPGENPAALRAGRAHLAAPAPAMPWVENGPVNGFPERVLAVVTADLRPVLASSLHPSFSDRAFARGFGTPVVDRVLSAWPTGEWSWGFVEAPVEM